MVSSPLPPFISQPDVTSWEHTDLKCWPPEHKSHGCHSRAKCEELGDTTQVMWPGRIARGYRKGLTPHWDLLTQLQWGHRKHRCRHWGTEAKLPCESVEIVPSEVIPDWLPKRQGPKKCHQRVIWGTVEDYSTLGMQSFIFHLPPNLPDSPRSTNPALGWVGFCSGKHQDQISPHITPWSNSAGKTRLQLFLHCFQCKNKGISNTMRSPEWMSRFPCQIYRQLETY